MVTGLFYLASAYCFRLDALDDVRRVQTFKIHIFVTTENAPLHKGKCDSGNNLQKETEEIKSEREDVRKQENIRKRKIKFKCKQQGNRVN